MHFFKKQVSSWLKNNTQGLISKYRQATWQNRQLPNFIIIGAQKAGTTSLYNYLSQHPDLIPSYEKEVHFFDGGLNPNVDNFEKGLTWYLSNFPRNQGINKDRKIFEASPLYIFNPIVPKRIFELIPEVKLIVILRNPVERAISHYFHEKKGGREPLSLMKALQAEEERLKPVIDNQDYKSNIFRSYSYKKRGIYHEQIERYFGYFSTSNILVINSETFFSEANETLKRVFEFVGVDPKFIVRDLKPRNVGIKRTEINSDVYEYLEKYFQPHNQLLYELIGQNYGW